MHDEGPLVMPKLRILHVLSQRPDSTGSGIYLQAMLREAVACNHDNFVVAGVQSDRFPELDCIEQNQCMFVKFYQADISYRIVGMSDVMPYNSRRFNDLSRDELHEYETAFTKTLKDAAATFEPTIIHSHHLWIVSSLARQLFPNIPMVTTCHGSDLRLFQNCPHLQERVLRGCRALDAVMALSEAQWQEIVRLYGLAPAKVAVVGAGYDAALFTANSKPDPHPVQLIYAGKLSKAKGVPWLLRALSMIDGPAWKLHLVGAGSGEETDCCLMLAKGLGERVVVHGGISHQSVAEIMKQSHILVLPSFYEGFGLVLLEGLAAGCRIVATDLSSSSELLRDVEADFISLIKTPRLHGVDRPYDEDEGVFEHDLAHALQTQMFAACRRPAIDVSPIRDKMASFSWSGVFRRVQDVYWKVVGA